MPSRAAADFLPLTPLSLHLLLSLAAGEQHGYGMMKEIRERTGGQLNPATGTVYLALQRLEDDGLIEPGRKRRAANERRRYFRLTRLGREVATAEARRLASMVGLAAARNLLTRSDLGRLVTSSSHHG